MKLYKHKKTGKLYSIIADNFMFKENGVWKDNLILYYALYDSSIKYFSRTKEDFYNKFEEVKENSETDQDEDYKKVSGWLSLSFMNYLDSNKKPNKMCLSNGECKDIDDAFKEQDWDKLARYLKKYL